MLILQHWIPFSCTLYTVSRLLQPVNRKVADSARKAVKLAEPYKSYGGQFLEFCSISLSTYRTCMKLTRKSTEFCQFFCRHYPPVPTSEMALKDMSHNYAEWNPAEPVLGFNQGVATEYTRVDTNPWFLTIQFTYMYMQCNGPHRKLSSDDIPLELCSTPA